MADLDDLNLEFDDFDFGEEDEDTRKPFAVDVISNVGKEVKSVAMSGEFAGKLAASALPGDSGEVVSEVVSGVSDSFDAASEELAKTGRMAKGLLKDVSTFIPGEGPKKFLNKIGDKLGGPDEEHYSSSNQEQSRQEIEDNQISNVLAEVFDKTSRQQAESVSASIKVGELQHEQTLKASQSQSGVLTAILQHNQGLDAWRKKTLEYKIKSFNLLKRLTESSIGYHAKTAKLLKSISHHTGLPDIVKMRKTEQAGQILLNNTIERAYGNVGSLPMVKRVTARLGQIGKNAHTSLNNFLTTAVGATSTADSMSGSGMSAGATTGVLLSSLATDSLSAVAEDLVASKAEDKLGKKGKEKVDGYIYNALTASDRTLKSLQAKSANAADGSLVGDAKSKAYDFLATLFGATGEGDTVLHATGQASSYQNFGTKDSTAITKVIPTYLSLMLRELSSIRTGEDDTETLVWNYEKNGMERGSTRRKRIVKRVNQLLKGTEGANVSLGDKLSDKLKEKHGVRLTSKDKRILYTALSRFPAASIKTGGSLLGLDSFTDTGPLQDILYDGLDQGDVRRFKKRLLSIGDMSNSDKLEILKLLGDFEVGINGNTIAGIQDIVSDGGLPELRNMGIVNFKEDSDELVLNTRNVLDRLATGESYTDEMSDSYDQRASTNTNFRSRTHAPASTVNSDMKAIVENTTTITTTVGDILTAIEAIDRYEEENDTKLELNGLDIVIPRIKSMDTSLLSILGLLPEINTTFKGSISSLGDRIESSNTSLRETFSTRLQSLELNLGDHLTNLNLNLGEKLGSLRSTFADSFAKVNIESAKRKAKSLDILGVISRSVEATAVLGSVGVMKAFDTGKRLTGVGLDAVSGLFKMSKAGSGILTNLKGIIGDKLFGEPVDKDGNVTILDNIKNNRFVKMGSRYIKGDAMYKAPGNVYADPEGKNVLLKFSIMREGGYFDAKSRKVVKTLGDIRGPVVDSDGVQVLYTSDIEQGIYNDKGRKIKVSSVGLSKLGILRSGPAKLKKALTTAMGLGSQGKGLLTRMIGKIKGIKFSKEGDVDASMFKGMSTKDGLTAYNGVIAKQQLNTQREILKFLKQTFKSKKYSSWDRDKDGDIDGSFQDKRNRSKINRMGGGKTTTTKDKAEAKKLGILGKLAGLFGGGGLMNLIGGLLTAGTGIVSGAISGLGGLAATGAGIYGASKVFGKKGDKPKKPKTKKPKVARRKPKFKLRGKGKLGLLLTAGLAAASLFSSSDASAGEVPEDDEGKDDYDLGNDYVKPTTLSNAIDVADTASNVGMGIQVARFGLQAAGRTAVGSALTAAGEAAGVAGGAALIVPTAVVGSVGYAGYKTRQAIYTSGPISNIRYMRYGVDTHLLAAQEKIMHVTEIIAADYTKHTDNEFTIDMNKDFWKEWFKTMEIKPSSDRGKVAVKWMKERFVPVFLRWLTFLESNEDDTGGWKNFRRAEDLSDKMRVAWLRIGAVPATEDTKHVPWIGLPISKERLTVEVFKELAITTKRDDSLKEPTEQEYKDAFANKMKIDHIRRGGKAEDFDMERTKQELNVSNARVTQAYETKAPSLWGRIKASLGFGSAPKVDPNAVNNTMLSGATGPVDSATNDAIISNDKSSPNVSYGGSTVSGPATGMNPAVEVTSSNKHDQRQIAIATKVGKRFGVSPAMLIGMAAVESNIGRNLQSPITTARGTMQFLKGTEKKFRAQALKSMGRRVPFRSLDAEYGYSLGAAYMLENARLLKARGEKVNLQNLYLYHNLGAGSPEYNNGAWAINHGVKKYPNKLVSTALSAKVIRNNPAFYLRHGKVVTFAEAYKNIGKYLGKKLRAHKIGMKNPQGSPVDLITGKGIIKGYKPSSSNAKNIKRDASGRPRRSVKPARKGTATGDRWSKVLNKANEIKPDQISTYKPSNKKIMDFYSSPDMRTGVSKDQKWKLAETLAKTEMYLNDKGVTTVTPKAKVVTKPKSSRRASGRPKHRSVKHDLTAVPSTDSKIILKATKPKVVTIKENATTKSDFRKTSTTKSKGPVISSKPSRRSSGRPRHRNSIADVKPDTGEARLSVQTTQLQVLKSIDAKLSTAKPLPKDAWNRK